MNEFNEIVSGLSQDKDLAALYNEFQASCNASEAHNLGTNEGSCPACFLNVTLQFLNDLGDGFSHEEACEEEDCEVFAPEEFVQQLAEDHEEALHFISKCATAISALTQLQRAASFMMVYDGLDDEDN